MNNNLIDKIYTQQHSYFKSAVTFPVSFRIEQLKKLYQAILKYESSIHTALYNDLGKSSFEGYMCEIGLVLSEITYMIKHLRKFTRKRRVPTPYGQFPSKCYTISVPYGNVLIMSPWNYPFLLTLEPLVDAIAAGNTAIIKPSAYSPHTADIVETIIKECFDEKYVAVIKGGREKNSALLDLKFDLVFFTGSQAVGKEVLRHTAENLTPAILELGGKSPCIVDSSADIKVAARRIVFGKYLNCGQTCVAPDYILCEQSIKDEFVSEVCRQIQLQFGDNPLSNKDYGKIINRKHFDRLLGLIEPAKVVCGGNNNPSANQIAPTVMDNVTYEDAVMKEEIFGPIMPILTYDNLDSIIDKLKEGDRPLALYIFSGNQTTIERITREVTYGGGCVNDTIIHLTSSDLGFGGVGASGMGKYHGKDGFDAFSHQKSILDKKTWLDLPMRYQPYTNKRYAKIVRDALK